MSAPIALACCWKRETLPISLSTGLLRVRFLYLRRDDGRLLLIVVAAVLLPETEIGLRSRAPGGGSDLDTSPGEAARGYRINAPLLSPASFAAAAARLFSPYF